VWGVVVLAGRRGGGGRGGRKFINSSSRVIGYRCSVPNIELEGTHSHFIVCVRPDDDNCPTLSAFVHPCPALHGAFIFWIYTPLRRRGRGTMWTSLASMMMTIPLITITTVLFFPWPLRHSFVQNASSLSHPSLTCIVSLFGPALLPFPLLELLSFCFRFGCTTPPIPISLWFLFICTLSHSHYPMIIFFFLAFVYFHHLSL